MNKSYKRIRRMGRWLAMSAILTGGTIMQASCNFNEVASQITAGLATSITNQYIGRVIDDYLGVGGGFSLSSLM